MNESQPPLSDADKRRLLGNYSRVVEDRGKENEAAIAQRKKEQETAKEPLLVGSVEGVTEDLGAGELTGMGQVADQTRGVRPISPERSVDNLEHDEKGWYRMVNGKKVYEK